MIELRNYLANVDPQAREEAISRYEAMFDETGEEKENEVIARLGSPARVAVAIMRELDGRPPANPKPNPAPEAGEDESPEAIEESIEEDNNPDGEDTPAAPEAEELEKEAPAEGVQEQPDDSGAASAQPVPEKRLRPFLLVLYIIPAVVIGIPLIALALAVSIAFFVGGVAALAGGVQAFILGFSVSGLIADSLLLFGGGLVIFALGLFVTWFSIWLCASSLRGIAGGIFSLGRRACYKEVRSS
jgi:uncharacterized membrane protein